MKPKRKQTTVRLAEGLLRTAAAVEEARSGQPMEEIPGEALESFEKFEEYISRSGI